MSKNSPNRAAIIGIINGCRLDLATTSRILGMGILFYFLFVSFSFSRIVYVDDDAIGLVDGTSWTDAYKSLQSALMPALPGDTLWVAAGTYQPDLVFDSISFVLKNDVVLLGGFNGSESDVATRDPGFNITILSGNIVSPIFVTDNSKHVLVASGLNSSAILDGFLIRDGYDFDSGEGPGGAGIQIDNSDLIIRNCSFLSNQAGGDFGGAVSILNTSSPQFIDCRFEGNSSDRGGAVFSENSTPSFQNCTFLRNNADFGAGIYIGLLPAVITDCIFESNVAANDGGGIYTSSCPTLIQNSTFARDTAFFGAAIYIGGPSPLRIEGCDFNENYAMQRGGAILNFNTSSTPDTLRKCRFISNTTGGGAVGLGGAMCSLGPVVIYNSILAGNFTPGEGGAIYSTGADIELGHCTVFGNQSLLDGAGIKINSNALNMLNSILWGNYSVAGEHEISLGMTGVASVNFSDVQSGGWEATGVGNISADPLFKDPLTLDLLHGCNSEVVNAASFGLLSTDINGVSRSISGMPDMGAYEIESGPTDATLSILDGEICQGENDTIVLTILGGKPPYDVNIAGTSGLISGIGSSYTYAFTPSESRAYSLVTVEDSSGCILSSFSPGTESISLVVNPRPTGGIVQGEDDICIGEDASLNVKLVGGTPPYDLTVTGYGSLLGYNSEDAFIVSPVVTSSYKLSTLIDSKGCTMAAPPSSTKIVAVHAYPVASFSSPTSICRNDPDLVLTGSPADITSFSGLGTYTPDGSSWYFSPASIGPGTYTLGYVATNAIGCSDTITAAITVDDTPVLSMTDLDDSYCEGTIVTPIPLVPTPVGGTVTGISGTGTDFDPDTEGPGTYFVTYTYTDPVTTCAASIVDTTEVFARPTPVILGTDPQYCEGEVSRMFIGYPGGGVFSGGGIIDTALGIFSPIAAGIGMHSISYTYADPMTGCSDSWNESIEISAKPVVTITTALPLIYVSDPPDSLEATPGGGIWAGPGVIGDWCYPSIAGVGTHSFTYEYSDSFGCVGTDTSIVTIIPPVVGGIEGLEAAYCENDAPDTLVGSPAGGFFVSAAMTGNVFYPERVSSGLDTVYYYFFDSLGSASFIFQPVLILDRPVDALTDLDDEYCSDAGAVFLSASPAGGSFTSSGGGISGSNFDPAIAAPGINIVSYSYADGYGCVYDLNDTTVVHVTPVVSISGLAVTYLESNPPSTLSASGASGTASFSGPGIPPAPGDTVFDPALATPGLHEIIMEFTNAFGCVVSDTDTVEVLALGTAAILGIESDYCMDDETVTLEGSPVDVTGYFTGPGITLTGDFTPTTAGAGVHTIWYHYLGPGMVPDSISRNVEVHVLPFDTILGLSPGYCVENEPVLLTGSPNPGGTFSGPGIMENTFEPATAGIGTFSIEYYVVDEWGCSNTDTSLVSVAPLPVITSFSLPFDTVCAGDAPIPLVATPLGGTFLSGIAVIADEFHPDISGPGTHVIEYILTDSLSGCATSEFDTMGVTPVSPASFSGLSAIYCESADTVTLLGSPLGGVFSGGGISGDQFIPGLPGVDTITYAYTDLNGCIVSHTQTVTVSANPSIIIIGLEPNYCEGSGADTLLAFPIGGTVSGPGVSYSSFGEPIFTASSVGLGSHTLVYNYTDSFTGCSSTSSWSTNVSSAPAAAFSVDNYCAEIPVDFSNSSVGSALVSDWDFGDGGISTLDAPDHVYAVAGTYDVSLRVTDDKGCFSEVVQSIEFGQTPDVDFNWVNVCEGGITEFASNPTGVPTLTHDWSFGDGATAIISNPTHPFSGGGEYTVLHTVTTTAGCVESTEHTVFIYDRISASELAYMEDFESGAGSWYAEGLNSSWEYGTPAGGKISTAYSGDNAWVTNLSGNYNNDENSWITSPCFDFSSIDKPMISFWTKSVAQENFDGMVLQASTDEGASWTNVGDTATGINWYNHGPIPGNPGNGSNPARVGWTLDNTFAWINARNKLDFLQGESTVQFRFAFGSDGSNSGEGFGIDDVWIGERSKVLILEQFTNSSNPSNVSADNIAKDLIEDLPGEVVSIHWHNTLPGADPMYADNPTDASARALYYSVNLPPCTVIDGDKYRDTLNLHPPTKNQMESWLLESPKFNLAVSQTLSGSQLIINTTVSYTPTEEIFEEEITVRNVVIERIVEVLVGANGQTEFEWVMKKIINGHPGRVFNQTWTPGAFENFSDTLDLSTLNIYDLSQIGVVSFVQNDASKTVYQSDYNGPDFLTSTVDPVVEGSAPEVLLYPNPANNWFIVRVEGQKMASLSLYDVTGKMIYRSSPKLTTARVETSGLPVGMYFARIVTSNGTEVTRKVEVIR